MKLVPYCGPHCCVALYAWCMVTVTYFIRKADIKSNNYVANIWRLRAEYSRLGGQAHGICVFLLPTASDVF